MNKQIQILAMKLLRRHWHKYRDGIPSSIQQFIYVALVVGVLAVRIWHCAQMPAHTGDITRHLLYGLLVNQQGLSAAGHPLVYFNQGYAGVCWSNLPYNYPVVTLLFFSLVTWIAPTLFFVRVCLTLLEGVSSFLVYGITRERWLALLYWASPISIWWTSREGQFEGLQCLFEFLAIYLLKRNPFIAFVVLALGVQVKLTAIFLLPFFIWVVWLDRKWRGVQSAFGMVLGFLPTVTALCFYPALEQLKYSAPLRYNPYFWNFFDLSMFSWNPTWMVWANQIGTYGMLSALLFWGLFRSRDKITYLPPILFLLACKWHRNVQFWYMVLFTSFALPIPERRFRFTIFLLAPLLDMYSLSMVFLGPLYFTVGGYYRDLTPFTLIHL